MPARVASRKCHFLLFSPCHLQSQVVEPKSAEVIFMKSKVSASLAQAENFYLLSLSREFQIRALRAELLHHVLFCMVYGSYRIMCIHISVYRYGEKCEI